jgi:hypothetical protein
MSSEKSFEFKFYSTLGMPLAIFVTGAIFYSFYYFGPSRLIRRAFHRGNNLNTKRLPSMASRVLASLFLAMRLLFLTMATTTLSIFNCTYDSKNENYYFEAASN